MLYSPQQSHLVGEDDLDCDRGMGNYWEPIDGPPGFVPSIQQGAPDDPALEADWGSQQNTGNMESPVLSASSQRPGSGSRSGEGGDMSQYPPSGPRRPIGGDDEDENIRQTGQHPSQGRAGGTGDGGGDRQFTYYPEERYWTDYLRIAAPVLGVILMLGLAWFWINNLIGDDDDTPAATATATATMPPIVTNGTPTVPSTAGSPNPLTTPTAAATEASTSAPGGGEIAVGSSVVVANTGGDGANLRDQASTEGAVVATLPDGTALEVTGDAVEAENYIWWPVSNADYEGYIAEDFLELAE